MPNTRVECGCGFAVEGMAADVVAVAQQHARERHGMHVSDSMVLSHASVVDDVDLNEEAVDR